MNKNKIIDKILNYHQIENFSKQIRWFGELTMSKIINLIKIPYKN